MNCDLLVFPVWGLKPKVVAPLITMLDGSWTDHHLALHFYDEYGTDLVLHSGDKDHPVAMKKYEPINRTFGNPRHRIDLGHVDINKAWALVGQRRSSVRWETFYSMFSTKHGRVAKLLPLKTPTNCTTLVSEVLGLDYFYPSDLLKEILS